MRRRLLVWWARVVADEVTGHVGAAFLTEVVVPAYRAAGWRLQRVLTDNGKAFKGRFGTTCAARGIRHTRSRLATGRGSPVPKCRRWRRPGTRARLS
jgi:hypothetical protein